jgi:uncharacterized membrane protein SpoIIM required for sporulation
MIIFVPMTLGAAFLESYITHLVSETFDREAGGGVPLWVSAMILIASLGFVAWYFIVYPIRVERKFKQQPHAEMNVQIT